MLIIVQRFSGPHHYDIGNPFSHNPLDPINLRKHFRNFQIPIQAAQSGCTKPAPHSAACLGRDTDRITVFVFHPHTFYPVSVFQLKQKFVGAILFGSLAAHHAYLRDLIDTVQFFPQLYRKIGHFRKVLCPFHMYPLINLSGPELLFPDRFHFLLQLFEIQ